MTIDDLMTIATQDGRICPQPNRWHQLYEMLPEKIQRGHGWEPALPLILGAWWHADEVAKRALFHEHLRWAYAHGVGAPAAQFLNGLSASDWYSG